MIRNRLAIASVSLGQHPSHTLPDKIRSAAQHGIRGMEITYPDLEAYATSQSISLRDAAFQIRTLCGVADIYVLALVSFQNFEGSKTPLAERLDRGRHWMSIARALGAEHIQIPSSYENHMDTVDWSVIVTELQQLSDLAAAEQPDLKLAYENLAWSKHCSTWQQAAQIVKAVDRENFGLCLDSFHLAVSLWADPYVASGRQAGGDEKLAESLRAYAISCPREKLFYIQLSDGECMDPPYSDQHPWYDPTLAVGHAWSNEARPFPLEIEYGAYMPVEAIARAMIVDSNYQGWVSLEIFDRRMKLEKNGPEESALRAEKSWQRLKEKLQSTGQRAAKL